MPELPPIRAKVELDDKALHQTAATSEAASKRITDAMGGASTATQKLEGHQHALHDSSLKVAGAHEVHGNALHQLEGKASSLGGVLGQLGPMGQKAASGLEEVSSKAGTMGGALGLVGGIAAGVGLAVVGFAVEASNKYLELTEKVHSYMRVTGESAGEASRQVEAFRMLGVSEETAAASMVKLGKIIEQHPAKLAALNIEVARNADGNVNMSKTLGNVADAYNATTDPAARLNIVLTAFGKAGAAMIPVLEQGSAGLAKFEAQAKMVLTDADIEQAHQYAIAQKQLVQQWSTLVDTAGKSVVPALAAVTKGLNEQSQVTDMENAYIKEHNLNWFQALGVHKQMGERFKKDVEDGNAATESLRKMTDAQHEASTAVAEQQKAIESLDAAMEKEVNAALKVEKSQIDMKKALDGADKAQDNLTATITKYGPKSEEAAAAATLLKEAQIRAEEAAIHDATAQRDLAADQAVAAGSALKAGEKHDVFVAALARVRDSLAPGSDLRNRLDGYLAQLNAIPANKNTTITNTIRSIQGDGVTSGALSGNDPTPRASGGPVLPGQIYTVGESGPETLVMGGSGGFVLPGASAFMAGVGGFQTAKGGGLHPLITALGGGLHPLVKGLGGGPLPFAGNPNHVIQASGWGGPITPVQSSAGDVMYQKYLASLGPAAGAGQTSGSGGSGSGAPVSSATSAAMTSALALLTQAVAELHAIRTGTYSGAAAAQIRVGA